MNRRDSGVRGGFVKTSGGLEDILTLCGNHEGHFLLITDKPFIDLPNVFRSQSMINDFTINHSIFTPLLFRLNPLSN